MARSITTIQDEIIAEKANHSELAGLSSSSQTAIWRLWTYVIAVAIWTLEKLWDAHKLEVQGIAENAAAGTPKWYVAQSLLFQYGYTLTWNADELKYEYATLDESAQVVDRAAVREAGGYVVLKVAKLNGSTLEKLSTAEKSGFESYIDEIKFAGTYMNIISEDPDDLKVTGTVYYDPQIPQTTVQANVEAAISSYLAGLPFDGTFRTNHLIDAIQAVEGVIDIDASVEAKYGILSYSTVNVSYVSFAGYMHIDPVYPLSTTLTYTVA